jgi:cytochrome c oxidase cbb3-type subunit 3
MTATPRFIRRALVGAALLLAPVAIRRLGFHDAVATSSSNAKTAARADAATADSLRFVEHPDTYPIGWPTKDKPLALVNPYEGNATAVAMGARLYIAYNCIDCHGADGSGSMGPSLADGRWHFGGRNPEVFESIYEGRPAGMPAWGGRISNDQIWQLVSYVRSLNGGRDVSSDNFSGRTVERTGH